MYKDEVDQLIKLLSTKLSEIVAETAFEFWQSIEFRKLIDFNQIPQAEQDRIFNELEVTGLGLLDLHLNFKVKNAPDKVVKSLLGRLEKELPQSFLDILSGLIFLLTSIISLILCIRFGHRLTIENKS